MYSWPRGPRARLGLWGGRLTHSPSRAPRRAPPSSSATGGMRAKQARLSVHTHTHTRSPPPPPAPSSLGAARRLAAISEVASDSFSKALGRDTRADAAVPRRPASKGEHWAGPLEVAPRRRGARLAVGSENTPPVPGRRGLPRYEIWMVPVPVFGDSLAAPSVSKGPPRACT